MIRRVATGLVAALGLVAGAWGVPAGAAPTTPAPGGTHVVGRAPDSGPDVLAHERVGAIHVSPRLPSSVRSPLHVSAVLGAASGLAACIEAACSPGSDRATPGATARAARVRGPPSIV